MENNQMCVQEQSLHIISEDLVSKLVSVSILEQDTSTDPATTTVLTNTTSIKLQPQPQPQSEKCKLMTCNCSCFNPYSDYYDPRCFGAYHICCRKPLNTNYKHDSCLCFITDQCCICKSIGDFCAFYITGDGMTPSNSCEANACCTLACLPCKMAFSIPWILGFLYNKIMNIMCCTYNENYLF